MVLCALLGVQASHMTDSLRAACVSFNKIYIKKKKKSPKNTLRKNLLCAISEMFCCSRDAELRPGLGRSQRESEGKHKQKCDCNVYLGVFYAHEKNEEPVVQQL